MTETTTGKSIFLAVLRNLALTLYALFALFPLLWMLILSFKPDSQMLTTMFRFSPTWQNYAEIFLRSDYLQYFLNNLIVSTGAVVLALIVGVPAAYALARFKFPGREDLAFTMLSFRFAPELFVILPLFLIYQRIGLLDTYFGLIWVYQLIALPLLIWVVRGYFEDISPELEYAAQLDGYSWWQVFLKVLLPLVRPGLAAAGLLAFIFSWNNFTFPLLLSGNHAQTSTVVILRFIGSDSVRYGQLAAAATITALPVVLLALAIQRHLVRGLSFGAVKG